MVVVEVDSGNYFSRSKEKLNSCKKDGVMEEEERQPEIYGVAEERWRG